MRHNYSIKMKVTFQEDGSVYKGICGCGSDFILLYDKKELILISLHMNSFQEKKKIEFASSPFKKCLSVCTFCCSADSATVRISFYNGQNHPKCTDSDIGALCG